MNRFFFFSVLFVALLSTTILLLLEQTKDQRARAALTVNEPEPIAEATADSTQKPTADADQAQLTLPEAPANVQTPKNITLWEDQPRKNSGGSHRSFQTYVNPKLLKQFEVGQTLSLSEPGSGSEINAQIDATHNQGRFAKVWTASSTADPETRLTITQGQIETHLTIVNQGRVYSAIIDNETGNTVLVDEAELAEKTIPYEDGVALPVNDVPLPPI